MFIKSRWRGQVNGNTGVPAVIFIKNIQERLKQNMIDKLKNLNNYNYYFFGPLTQGMFFQTNKGSK